LVPKVTDDNQNEKYWRNFNEWLKNGGLRIIVWWAKEFLKKHSPVLKGQQAPMTASKREIIKEQRSEFQTIICDTLETINDIKSDSSRRQRFEKLNMIRGDDVVIIDTALLRHVVDAIQANGGFKGPPPQAKAVRKIAKAEGWWMTERNKLGPRPVVLICSSRDLSKRTPNEICHDEANKLVPFDLKLIETL